MFLLTELKTVSMKCVEEFNASFNVSMSDQSGVAQLAEEIGRLYLRESFSDVTIVVNGTELPAHRMILSQRCTYLENMLEETPNRIELRKTPINGFRSVLKWIYTGETEFTQMDNALEVLRLSNKYKLVELEKLAGEYVEANFNVDNFCAILNSLTSWSANGSLIKDFLSKSGDAVLVHETFSDLHKDSMKVMLEELPYDLTNVEILQAFVRWMYANRDKSKHFPDLLKLISLNSIDFDELASVVPNELISANVVIEVAHEQRSMYESGKKDTNFATAKYGAKVTIGNEDVFMSNRYLDESTVETTEVVIDLRQHVKLNLFSASRDDNYSELSPIDISVSTDGATWTRVVYQGILENPPFNDFHFDERVVRFIRINGQLPLKKVLELDNFQAYYE